MYIHKLILVILCHAFHRSGKEGTYPDLIKTTEEKLREVKPTRYGNVGGTNVQEVKPTRYGTVGGTNVCL